MPPQLGDLVRLIKVVDDGGGGIDGSKSLTRVMIGSVISKAARKQACERRGVRRTSHARCELRELKRRGRAGRTVVSTDDGGD